MRKPAFIELIQQVRAITGTVELVIVGSHCLYAVTEQVPEVVARSVEADFLLGPYSLELMIQVNADLGVASPYFKEYGNYADALGLASVTLLPGWETRLQPLADGDGQIIARCLELYDVAVSKLMAGRDKDWAFLSYLLDAQLIALPDLVGRAALIQQTAAEGALLPRLEKLLANLQKHHTRYDLATLRQLIHQLKFPNP
ncbi:MAG: hypothetical protein HYR56_05140 [Acidobacteria bacterium]|nr:hypothetical protein [Acidobacteriota bacterium]MBI3423647.1 hypothetical protein [Acidobacteriota bacterium]